MSELSEKRLMRELEKMQKSPNPQFTAFPNPKNIYEWHFLLYNIDDSPYAGGQFHGKILIPREYPLKPPAIIFLTPQGRFKCGEKICLSFTNYHPEMWSTSWTIQAMLVGLISFMHTKENTLGGLSFDDHQKQNLARSSTQFNYNNPEFIEIFKDKLEEIKQIAKEPQPLIQETTTLQIQEQSALNNTTEHIQNYQELVVQDNQIRINRQQQRRYKQRMIMYLLGILIIIAFLILIYPQ